MRTEQEHEVVPAIREWLAATSTSKSRPASPARRHGGAPVSFSPQSWQALSLPTRLKWTTISRTFFGPRSRS